MDKKDKNMNKLKVLVLIDCQNDFIDGSLANKDAILDGIIPNEHDAARAYVIEEFNKLNK